MADSPSHKALFDNHHQTTDSNPETEETEDIVNHQEPGILTNTESIKNGSKDTETETNPGAKEASVSTTPDGPQWSIWNPKEKKLIIFAGSFSSLFSPLSGQIYFPALNTIAKDLNVSNSLVTLSITTYLIFQGIAPTFTAQLSDTAGRRPSYMICFVFYMAANIGLGAQNNYAVLLILRCLQSAGSSGTVALASAVAADIVTSAELGSYISYATAVPMLAPSIGPIIGGAIATFAGWHWVFWFLLILSGLVAIPMALFFPETCRKIVGDGSIPPPKWNRCYTNIRKERKALREGKTIKYDERDELARTRHIRFPNPFTTILLLLQKECGYALFFSAFLSCTFYATMSLIPSQFGSIYKFNDLQISLCYIPFGFGSLVAAFNRGRMIDSNFRRHAKRLGISYDRKYQADLTDFPIERARLEVAIPTVFLSSAFVIGFGWMLQAQVNLAGPLIFSFGIGFCLSASINTVQVLMIDLYPEKTATVTASNNLVRCLLGAGATALVVPMIEKIGIGWCLTLFGLVNLVTTPLLWYIMREGPRWRAETRQKKVDEAVLPTVRDEKKQSA